MTRGEFAIIAATALVVLAVFLWIAVDKLEGIEPGCIVGGCGVYERSAGNPPLKVMPLRAVRTGRCPVQAGRTMASRCNSGQPPIPSESGRCGVEGNAGRIQTGPRPSSPGPNPRLDTAGSRFDSGQRLHFASDANRTGRAATTGESSVQSSRPKESGKLVQARLVCLFDAIRQVESGGNDYAVGDGERSLGPYQCGRAAWADGGGNPADYDRLVWNRAACERVMLGYWKRYGAVTDEQRARTWNGGPRGAEKKATLAYWAKVKGEMR